MLHANKDFDIKTSFWWGKLAVRKLSYHRIHLMCVYLGAISCRLFTGKSVYVFWWNPRGNIFWHFPQQMKIRESSFQVFSIIFFQSVLPQSMPCEPAIILLVKTLFLFIHVMMSGFCSLCHFAFLTLFHADAPLQKQAPKWGLMPLFSPCQPP